MEIIEMFWILTVLVITTGTITEISSDVKFDDVATCQAAGATVVDSVEGERQSRLITFCTPSN